MLIDLELHDGDYFNEDALDAIEVAISQSSPAGMVVMTFNTAAPTGWLFVQGQVVANAQILYPQWWTVMDPTWKVGVDAHLPNMTQKFPIGAEAGVKPIGSVGGANSRTLVAANLPAHAHAIDHDHAQFNSGIENVHHVHTSHPHSWGGPSYQYFVVQTVTPGGPSAFNISAGTGAIIANLEAIKSDEEQDSATGLISDHFHPVNVPPFAGSSGNGPGSSTPIDTTPSYMALNFMVRVY